MAISLKCPLRGKKRETGTHMGNQRMSFLASFTKCGKGCQLQTLVAPVTNFSLEFEGWSWRFSALTLVLCPLLFCYPPPAHPTRFQGPGQRLVVLIISSWNMRPRLFTQLLVHKTKSDQDLCILYLASTSPPSSVDAHKSPFPSPSQVWGLQS